MQRLPNYVQQFLNKKDFAHELASINSVTKMSMVNPKLKFLHKPTKGGGRPLSHIPSERKKRKKKGMRTIDNAESTITAGGTKTKKGRAKYPPNIKMDPSERMAKRDQSVFIDMLEKSMALSRVGNHETYGNFLDQVDKNALANWRQNVNYLNKVNKLHQPE